MDYMKLFFGIMQGIGALTAIIFVYIAWMIYKTPRIAITGAGLPTFMNIYVASAYILVLHESSPMRNTISDYGAPMSFIFMLVLVPLAIILSLLLLRKNTLDKHHRSYLSWSRVLWILQLIPAAQILFFMLAWASGR